MATVRDDLARQHLTRCRAERERLYAQLEAYRSGARTGVGAGKTRIDTTGETITRLEAEIAQLGDVIACYERELRKNSL